MPSEVSLAIMDTKAFAQQVLNQIETTGDFQRRVWDNFWRAILQHILEGDQLPLGTTPEIIPIVQKLLQNQESQAHKVASICPAFYKTNRSTSLAFSEVWCKTEYSNAVPVLFHTTSRGHAAHAEKQALERLQQQGERTTSVPRRISWYMNVSPCRDCAEALIAFKAANPQTRISIRVTSLFAHHAPNHRNGLQRMAQNGIDISVFDDKDWNLLSLIATKDSTGNIKETREESPRKKSKRSEDDEQPAGSSRKRQRVDN